MNRTPIVILGLQETGLFASQSFGKYHIPVYGFDFNLKNPGFYSRYIKSYKGANPFYEPEILLQQVIEKAKDISSRPILIASTEDYLGFIADHREELDKLYRFVLPGPDIIQGILNKVGQFELAKRCNFQVPDFYQISNKSEFTDYLHRYDHKKLIIKAQDQATWKAKVTKKAFIPGDFNELKEIGYFLTDKEVPFLIQHVIDGDCTNNFEFNALMINGEIVEYSLIQKLRQYPPGYGAACFIKTSKNPEIEELGRKFVTQNRLEGFSNTEFKFNPVDNKYYFIETNSRIWSQIRLTEYSGQNFLIQYYNSMADNAVYYKPIRKIKESKWIDIFSDFVLWWRFLRKDKMNLLEWLFSLKDTKDFGLLNFRDFKPFLHEISRIRLFRSKKLKV